MNRRLCLPIGDILLMAFVFLLALFLFALPFLAKEGRTAQIVLAETGEIRPVPLDTDGSYEVTARNIHLTVQVKNGAVFVSESDCRDGICRSTPKISRTGQSIVCAPAGVVIRITGEGADIDAVSG